MFKIQTVVLILMLVMNAFSFANNSQETTKEADIKRLVQLIDQANQGVEWLKELFVGTTKVDKSEHERLLREIDFDTVVALYYTLYDKYFTHDEIKELIEFYLTEHGMKMSRTKADVFGMQTFTPEEMEKIEEFKKTKIGRKYARLSNKITHQHSKLAMKFVDSLK